MVLVYDFASIVDGKISPLKSKRQSYVICYFGMANSESRLLELIELLLDGNFLIRPVFYCASLFALRRLSRVLRI